MICSNCGAEYESFHLFCHRCGCALPQEVTSGFSPEDGLTETFGKDILSSFESEDICEEESLTTGVGSVPEETEYDLDPCLPEPAQPIATQPKGRHWPAMLIMAVLSVIGIFLFYTGSTPASDVHSQGSYFTIENGVLNFYENYYTGGSSLTVPETVNGQTVTALADYCFLDCDSLSEIILPDTLETIGDYAFADCGSLRGILIPNNVSDIGDYAFSGCAALEAVSISSGVEEMGNAVFFSCGKLRHLFYSGSASEWMELYSEYINGEVTVYASDLTFSHDG